MWTNGNCGALFLAHFCICVCKRAPLLRSAYDDAGCDVLTKLAPELGLISAKPQFVSAGRPPQSDFGLCGLGNRRYADENLVFVDMWSD